MVKLVIQTLNEWSLPLTQMLPSSLKLHFPSHYLKSSPCNLVGHWAAGYAHLTGEKNRGPERRDQKVTVLEAKGDRPDLALAPLPHLEWHLWPPLPIQTSYLPALSLGWKPYPQLPKGGSASSTSPIYPQNLAQSRLAHWALQGRGGGQIHGRVPRVLPNTTPNGGRQQRLPGGGWRGSSPGIGHIPAWRWGGSKCLPSALQAQRLGFHIWFSAN